MESVRQSRVPVDWWSMTLPVGSPDARGRELYVVVWPMAALPVFAPVPVAALGPKLVLSPDRSVWGKS